MSKWIIVDVESDGPVPGPDMYSMVSFGAVVLTSKLDKTFYGQTAPISEQWVPEALAISNITREEHLKYPDPAETMQSFAKWLDEVRDGQRVVLVSDNPVFDGMFMNYYFHKYLGQNPFGYSGKRIGDMFAGLSMNIYASNNWKRLRKTKHDHNPVNDAMGVAEALLRLGNDLNLSKIISGKP